MGERHRVDGADQIGKPAQVLRGPADRLLHFADRAQTRQQPDAVLLLLGPLQLALLLLGEQVLPLVAIARPVRAAGAGSERLVPLDADV
jgi:hypothetical protein